MNEKANIINKSEKNKVKFKSRKILFLIIIILITLFCIHKVMIMYQLKTQVIAVVRFDFNGLENLFKHNHEYYAITENNKAIKISRNAMYKYNRNYSDNLSIHDRDKENIYKFYNYYGDEEIQDDRNLKYLNVDEQKKVKQEVENIYKILKELTGETNFMLYTDKNNYIIENDSHSSSTIYTYKDKKLTKVMDCPKGTGSFYYIYFIK